MIRPPIHFRKGKWFRAVTDELESQGFVRGGRAVPYRVRSYYCNGLYVEILGGYTLRVIHQNGRATGETRSLLLAALSGESSDETVVCQHAGADSGAAGSGGIAQALTPEKQSGSSQGWQAVEGNRLQKLQYRLFRTRRSAVPSRWDDPGEKLPSNRSAGSVRVYSLHGRKAKKEILVERHGGG